MTLAYYFCDDKDERIVLTMRLGAYYSAEHVWPGP